MMTARVTRFLSSFLLLLLALGAPAIAQQSGRTILNVDSAAADSVGVRHERRRARRVADRFLSLDPRVEIGFRRCGVREDAL